MACEEDQRTIVETSTGQVEKLCWSFRHLWLWSFRREFFWTIMYQLYKRKVQREMFTVRKNSSLHSIEFCSKWNKKNTKRRESHGNTFTSKTINHAWISLKESRRASSVIHLYHLNLQQFSMRNVWFPEEATMDCWTNLILHSLLISSIRWPNDRKDS